MRRAPCMSQVLMRCALSVVAGMPAGAAAADFNWGGSLGLTTDYLVRGISRSDHEPSIQGEMHASSNRGWMAGLFTSSTRIVPGEPRDAEIGVFLGRAWNWNADWSTKALVSHYSYPWNSLGSGYDYNELSLDVSFRDWLSMGLVYSPDAPWFVAYEGLIAAKALSGEINLQTPAWHRLTFNAGLGYSRFYGDDGAKFPYWSVGCALDLSPVTVSAGFVGSGSAAKELFYQTAAQNRWLAAVIWRF